MIDVPYFKYVSALFFGLKIKKNLESCQCDIEDCTIMSALPALLAVFCILVLFEE
jgi:hypothetical protein